MFRGPSVESWRVRGSHRLPLLLPRKASGSQQSLGPSVNRRCNPAANLQRKLCFANENWVRAVSGCPGQLRSPGQASGTRRLCQRDQSSLELKITALTSPGGMESHSPCCAFCARFSHGNSACKPPFTRLEDPLSSVGQLLGRGDPRLYGASLHGHGAATRPAQRESWFPFRPEYRVRGNHRGAESSPARGVSVRRPQDRCARPSDPHQLSMCPTILPVLPAAGGNPAAPADVALSRPSAFRQTTISNVCCSFTASTPLLGIDAASTRIQVFRMTSSRGVHVPSAVDEVVVSAKVPLPGRPLSSASRPVRPTACLGDRQPQHQQRQRRTAQERKCRLIVGPSLRRILPLRCQEPRPGPKPSPTRPA